MEIRQIIVPQLIQISLFTKIIPLTTNRV